MLTRWDPFREMMAIRHTMDRMFDSALAAPASNWQPMSWDLALDEIAARLQDIAARHGPRSVAFATLRGSMATTPES